MHNIDEKTEKIECWDKFSIKGKEYLFINQEKRTVYNDVVMIVLTQTAGPQKLSEISKSTGISYDEAGRALYRLETRKKVESTRSGKRRRTKAKYKFHYVGAKRKPE